MDKGLQHAKPNPAHFHSTVNSKKLDFGGVAVNAKPSSAGPFPVVPGRVSFCSEIHHTLALASNQLLGHSR